MSQTASDILSLVFGNITLIITLSIELPQLIAIFRTKNTSGTSLITYILFLVSSTIWVLWASINYTASISYIPEGVKNRILYISALVPAILSNLTNVILVGCILFIKISHLHACKKLNVSEIDYSKIIFDKQKGYSWIKKYYPLLIIIFSTLLVYAATITILYFLGIPKQMTPSEHDKYNLIVLITNICAAVFFESISWPQFIKSLKTKDTSGISLSWAIFLPFSCVICFSYDLFLGFSTEWTNVIASLICNGIFINIAVLVLKIINMKKARKLGISEWHYVHEYLTKHKKK